MRHEELIYLLALQKVEGVGDIIAKKLISHLGSAREIFESDSQKIKSIEGIGPSLLGKLKDKTVFAKAEAEANFIREHGIKVSSYLDPDYPERLKHCVDGPLLLFWTGNIDFRNRKIISIVGTRQATSHGADFCRKLIADLVPWNPIIVSGFAYGIDILAHQAAMDNNLQTIGIIGNGLSHVYPKVHKKYIAPMNQNGGFMTEFWSQNYPAPENFVRRNRIVAGMSEATIIVESAEKGGSLITANFANDYSREVFAVPGRVSDTYSQGCNRLIKTQRAHLLTGAEDLVYVLNWDLKTESKPVQKQLFVSLSAEEQPIYDFLAKNGSQLLDAISLELAIPVHRLSSILLSMELKGVIRPLPGKLFEAI